MSVKVATRAAAIDNGLIKGHEQCFVAYLLSGRDACNEFLRRVARMLCGRQTCSLTSTCHECPLPIKIRVEL